MLEKIYNPPYFDCEEIITLAAFYHPNPESVQTIDQWEAGIFRRYLQIATDAYENKELNPSRLYYDYIDENPFVDDAKSLVHCLMQSRKYRSLRNSIEKSITSNCVSENEFSEEETENLIYRVRLEYLFKMFNCLF